MPLDRETLTMEARRAYEQTDASKIVSWDRLTQASRQIKVAKALRRMIAEAASDA